MFNILILLALILVPTFAFPSQKLLDTTGILGRFSKSCQNDLSTLQQCFEKIESYDDLFEYEDALLNQTLMTSFFQDLNEVSSCLGTPKCHGVVILKYFLDGAVFVGEHIYGDAFECFLNEDLRKKFTDCAEALAPSAATSSDVLELLKPVAFCVAHKLECSVEDKRALVVAVHAGTDLLNTFSHLNELLLSGNGTDLVFEETKYEHLMN